jgi:5-methyltetrahydrofolate--homocysteine methyltransferase
MRNLNAVVAPPACLVADGGWGTELLKMGLQPGTAPERWNLDHPDRVLQVAKTYVEAGAQILLTNTLGGNTFRLASHALEASLEAINRRGAEISRAAAGADIPVFGSMGPTGKLLAMRRVNEQDVFESFRRQAEALASGGVDALLIETMGELKEMQIAARAARAVCPLPLVLSMTFDSGPDKTATMMGVTPEIAVREMEALDAWMVGANCGIGPESYVRVCNRMRAATSKPIWVKPNAGIPALSENGITYSQTPDLFGAFALRLREAGANVIGGCCGTTPAHISRLRLVLAEKSG